MYDTYSDMAHKYFLSALCCADLFRVIKYIYDALDRVRCKVINRYKNNKKSDKYYLFKYKILYINISKPSNTPSFIGIGEMLTNWRQEIINRFHTYDARRINNGPIERRNKYIYLLLDLINGYRNFKRFRHRVLIIFNKHKAPLKSPRDTLLIKLPGK